MDDTERQRYLTWITNQINAEFEYHNHKETMAWVVTALFIPSVIIFSKEATEFIKTSIDHRAFEIILELLLLKTILLYLIGAVLFVAKQFNLRAEAADTNAALIFWANELSMGRDINNNEKEIAQNSKWPEFVKKRTTDVHAKRVGRTTTDFLFTDVVCYVLMGISALVAFITTIVS